MIDEQKSAISFLMTTFFLHHNHFRYTVSHVTNGHYLTHVRRTADDFSAFSVLLFYRHNYSEKKASYSTSKALSLLR